MNRDLYAAQRITELREDMGLSPEALSYAVHRESPRTPVSGRTIRRIEATGRIPTPRVKYGIAMALGLKPSELWVSRPRSLA